MPKMCDEGEPVVKVNLPLIWLVLDIIGPYGWALHHVHFNMKENHHNIQATTNIVINQGCSV